MKKKLKLEDIRIKKMEGILIRSRAKWIDEGEKINKYFCNLENRNVITKSMTKIVSHNGTVLQIQDIYVWKLKHFTKLCLLQKNI